MFIPKWIKCTFDTMEVKSMEWKEDEENWEEEWEEEDEED
jgi:hypothetical protein